MSGFGGWTNPDGATHYVRPGDKVINMGTSLFVGGFIGTQCFGGMAGMPAPLLARPKPLEDDDPDLGDLWVAA